LKELAKFQDGWQDAFGIVNARVHGYIPVAADLIKSRQAAQTHKQRHWQPLKVQIHSQKLCFCIRDSSYTETYLARGKEDLAQSCHLWRVTHMLEV